MHGRRYYQWRLVLSAEFVLQLALKDLQKAPAGCGSGQVNEQNWFRAFHKTSAEDEP